MPEATWRVEAKFDSETRRYNPYFVLVDYDGTEVADVDDTPIGGFVRIPIERSEVTGPKSFDSLSLAELVDVNYANLTVTIANGESLSSSVTLDRRPILAILTPSGWDDAVMTFQVSLDGQTYYELVEEDGSAASLAVEAGTMLRTDNLDQWAGYSHMKVRSGTSGSAVAQTGAKVVTIVVRDA